MIASSSLPRSAPGFRWSLDGLPTPDWIARKYAEPLPFALTPVIASGRVIVRSRVDEAWAAFDVKTGRVLARAPLAMAVERCSAPGVAPDGRIAVVVFRSLAEGLSLEEYDADGTHRWSCPLPIPFAEEEGPTPADMGLPDYPPGPGSIAAPHAGPNGLWIVCAEEWVNNDAPWVTAAVRSGDPVVVWRRAERMFGATARVGIFFGRAAILGVDLLTGETRWQAATASMHRKVTFTSAERIAFQGLDGGVDIFTADGDLVASASSQDPIVAFDGERIIAASKHAIMGGPASEPGAWTWKLDAPAAMRGGELGIAAERGFLALCDRTTGTLAVYGPDPEGLPAALIGAHFVSEDGKLACLFERAEGPDDESSFRTTVWDCAGGRMLLAPVVTRWRPPTDPSSESPLERLGRMEAELDAVGVGDLYRLYVVRPNPDHATSGEKLWIAARPDTPLEELRLFPEYGRSPYTPDDWDWQDGWWYPYSTFRPAPSA